MQISEQPGKEQPESRSQAAALIVSRESGQPLVCLVTSRDTGRWIVPRGKVKRGEEPARCAEREALEEAGVIAHAAETPIAFISAGPGSAALVPLFLLEAAEILDNWPEKAQRKRVWETPVRAAQLAGDPNLVSVLLSL
ncbi:MAG: NUDIX hydrolase [Rhodomicrobium sp.]